MKSKSAAALALIIILIASGCSKKFYLKPGEESSASDWSYVRGDLQSTGVLESDFNGRLNLKWEKNVSERPIGPLTIGQGNLILCGSKGRAYFFDLNTGKYLGRYKANRAIQTGMVGVDSLAYFAVGPRKDELVCLNLLNAKKIWSLGLKDVTGTPIIMEDRLYVGCARGRVYCLDRLSGNVIWQDSAGAKNLAGPSGDGGAVYFPFDDGTIEGYDAMSGETLFKTDLGQPLIAKAAVGESIYVAGAEGGFYAVDKESGRIIWTKQFDYPIWTSPALDDGVIYIGDSGGYLRALRESGGEVLWEFKGQGVILASPIVVGDYVLFASLDRSLYCLDKQTGRLISKREFKRGLHVSPVSDGNIICAASHDGTIQCFGD
jgi:outer membrane protein assembly factor BamB